MNANCDSAPDTVAHIQRVQYLLEACRLNLVRRGCDHDASKLEEPEKPAFDACKEKLASMAYGSPEYKVALAELGPALQHHYAHNSHHPEHWPNGVDDMSLFDVIEMLMDWKAATERMKGGGDIRRSLEINAGRFKLSPQLASILANTIREMGW
jgi:hypothetical protein